MREVVEMLFSAPTLIAENMTEQLSQLPPTHLGPARSG